MKLSELKSGGQQRHQSQQTQSFNEPGTIRNAVAYPNPIEALYQGQPVTVLATGDIVGMSPAVQIVDEQGQLDWVSTDGGDLTITQRDVLPQSEQQRQRLFQNQRRQQGQQNT